MERDDLVKTHKQYKLNDKKWDFFIKSYYGGFDYKMGGYLTKYVLERDDEYEDRLANTAIDNHCRNIVQVYSSFLFRIPPTREFGSLVNDQALDSFLRDADLDGRSFDSIMKEAQVYSSVYGHCWMLLDKPPVEAKTRAEELGMEIRPYLSIFTPENIYDWKFDRMMNGRYELSYLKIRESYDDEFAYFKIWTREAIKTYKLPIDDDKGTLVEEMPNPLGKIPAVILYNQRSPERGVGISDLSDVAEMQKAIYNELSEIEQLIRISNHPSLVKTPSVQASAGAGSVVQIPEDLNPALKPYQLQPSGANLEAIMKSINTKIESIDRMTHMGSVRATATGVQSGVALETEFQLLNARLSEKGDLLELAEEQLWKFWAMWQDREFDGEIKYPDSFNLRDWTSDLQYLMTAKASGIRSSTFQQEIDKQIASQVIDDDEVINTIHQEIEQNATVGDFGLTEPEPATIPEV
jgi:hypothetical protein